MDINELKTKICELIDDVEGIVHPLGLNQIRKFVEVNELKLAVETICDHIGDAELDIDKDLKNKIIELSKRLCIPDTYWDSL